MAIPLFELLLLLIVIASTQSSVIFSPSTKTGDLYKIGARSGTDKITHHGYHRFYPQYIERFRDISEEYGLLEIGVANYNSIKTWIDYFSKAYIYGIDINSSGTGERYQISKVDQSNKDQLSNFISGVNHKIFFILDDGSHIPEHQILTFDVFFRDLLLPGGVYIIEDIETSYWKRNGLYGYKTRYGINHPDSAVEYFKGVIDYVNSEYLSQADLDELLSKLSVKVSAETLKLIQSISFGQNCIVITKKTAEEISLYDNREYRFRGNV